MKYLTKLSVRVVLAIAVGFLLAGAFTKITYPCSVNSEFEESAEGCVSFEKAITHPDDLIRNKQGSLTTFLTTLILTGLISFALISVANVAYKKKT